mmetsp:Transcript_31021/g.95995  ORF Transcript_31021/g.95995 Transcript_31021/m.95995 type:complete len:109 (-) Transcript_31021:483-809(-)
MSESVTCPTWRYAPSKTIVRITPHEVTYRPFVRNLVCTVQGQNLVYGVQAWRQATMRTKKTFINCGCKREVVEEVRKHFPNICAAVLANALVIEAIDLSNLPRFMIAS